MSLGAASAGISVRVAVELDASAAETYSRAHPDTCVIHSPVERITALPSLGRRAILFGGPPCRGFSISNQRTRSPLNTANWLFKEFLRIARVVQPSWVILENVTGILETAHGTFISAIIKGLERLGYTVSVWVLNAADFGVPQLRRRVFIVGNRGGTQVPAPVPGRDRISVIDAIGDLPALENGSSHAWLKYGVRAPSAYARALRGALSGCSNHIVTRSAPHIIERYRHIPQGGNWRDIPQALMRNYSDVFRCHTGIYRRLRADSPGVVIGNFRKNMLIHPTQNRGLSVREAARLQSFPDNYEFMGSIGYQQQQVGNAVPPALAAAVFRRIMEHEGAL